MFLGNVRLVVVVTAHDDSVPERIDFSSAIIHNTSQPGIEGLGSISVTITIRV